MAVVLQCDKEKMLNPVVIAKGYDAVTQRIKAIARANDVILTENMPLALVLAKEVELGHPVATKWHQGAAEVLSPVYKLRTKAG